MDEECTVLDFMPTPKKRRTQDQPMRDLVPRRLVGGAAVARRRIREN
jgi:hypothetical protein